MVKSFQHISMLIILTLCIFFSCKQEFTNPLSENYQGDYQFSIILPFTDSVAVFTPCPIIVRTTGTDEFKNFTLEENSIVESKSIQGTDSIFDCIFTNSSLVDITITGLRPNGKSIINTVTLKTFNPFKIDGAPLINESGNTYRIIRTEGNSEADSLLYADWLLGDSVVCKNQKMIRPFNLSAPAGDYELKAIIKRSSASINVPSFTVLVRHEYLRPSFTVSSMEMQSTATKPFLIRLPAVSHGEAISYMWDKNDDGVWDTTTEADSLITVFNNPGKKTIIASFEDSSKAVSEPCTISVNVQNPGVPAIRSVQIDTADNYLYIYDNRTVTVTAEDDEGEIVNIFIRNNLTGKIDSIAASGTSSTAHFSVKQTSSGTIEYLFYARDNDGNLSDTVRKSYLFKTGKPEIRKLTLKNDTIFQMDTVSLSADCFDTNGSVVSYLFKSGLPSDSVYHRFQSQPVTFVYQDSGKYTISFFISDDDGISSDTIQKAVVVRSGIPRISAVSFLGDTGAVFINDTFTLKIKAYDPDHTIDSCIVFWTDESATRLKADGDSTLVSHVFSSDESGEQMIHIQVKDSHAFTDDTVLKMMVRSAVPVIDSIKPHEIWIHDTLHCTLFAHDTNGTIQMYYFDFNNDSTWDHSSQSTEVSTVFSDAGMKRIRTGARDDDGNCSESVDSICVRKGTPRIWNNGDTMFVVSPSQGGNVNLKINSYDTNGTIQRYFWDYFEGDGFDTLGPVSQGNVTTGDSIQVQILAPVVNLGFRMGVFGIDDDGIIAGDTFWLFPDAPPPPVEATNATVGDSVVLHWKNMDFKDSLKTQFQILIKEGDEPSVSDIAVDFKPGSNFRRSTFGTFQFMWTFKGGQSGKTYYYRIVARDARGSLSPDSSKDDGSFSFQ